MSMNPNPYKTPDAPDPFAQIEEPKPRKTRSCLTMVFIAMLVAFLILPVVRALPVYYRRSKAGQEIRTEPPVSSYRSSEKQADQHR